MSSTASFKVAGSGRACDLNADAAVNVLDVQLAADMTTGAPPCTAPGGFCNDAFYTALVNAALPGGACVLAALSATPASISFGNVVVSGSSSQTVSLSVTGTGSITISQATVTGAGLSINGLSLPLTLPAGQSANFNVAFAPAIAGAASGSVTLTSNALNSSVNIALSGTGVTSISHNVQLSWTASTSANVAGYNVYRIASSSQTPPSPPYPKVNSSLVSETSYTDTSVVAGQYYYYATAVDTSSAESAPSNTAPAVVPGP